MIEPRKLKISPEYLHLLAEVMKEAGVGDVSFEVFGDWLGSFKFYIQKMAESSGMKTGERFPSWEALLVEESRLVAKG